MKADQIKTIAIVGAGDMGHGIAEYAPWQACVSTSTTLKKPL